MTKLEKITGKISAFDQKTSEMKNEYERLNSEYRSALKEEAVSDRPDDTRVKKLREQLRDLEDRLEARGEVRESLETEKKEAFRENKAENIKVEAEQQRNKIREIERAVSDMKKGLKAFFEAAAIYHSNKIYSPHGLFNIEDFVGKSVTEKLTALRYKPDTEISKILSDLYERLDYLPAGMLSEINKTEGERLSGLGV